MQTVKPPRPLLPTSGAMSLCAAGLLVAAAAHAQYPDHAIRIVVPFPPGNAPDLQARMVGERLTAELKQPVIVENRPGGNTVIGAQTVAQAKPDGYTLYMTTSQHLTLPSLIKNLSFDPVRDFVPITTMSASELSITVRTDAAVSNYADFIRWAKEKPGALTYGSGGIGSPGHLTCAAVADRAGLSVRHIPYKGVTDAMAATLAGTVDFTCSAAANLLVQIKAGKLKAIITTGEKRHPALADTPTFREADAAGMVLTSWSILLAPRGTPQPILAQLNAVVTGMIRSPDYVKFTARIGSSPAPRSLAEAADLFVTEERHVRAIIRKAGILPE